jgi:hypothetical protein
MQPASNTVDSIDMAPHRSTPFQLLLISASVSLWGQTSAPPMPEWLSPFPEAEAQQLKPTEGSSSYTALAPAADVTTHYQKEMRDGGVAFKVQGDGIGLSIVATDGRLTAVVRVRDGGDRSNVKVTWAVKAESVPTAAAAPSAVPVTPGQVQPIGSQPILTQPIPGHLQGQRAPLTPWTRTPYVWILESAALPGTSPARYTMGYYEAPTEAAAQRPLPLPAGATIIDIFPKDCSFSMHDQTARSLTFRSAKEALGQVIDPGAWSVHPITCRGIQVYLR